MATTALSLKSRLAALNKLRCSIFQTSYNPTSVRTGAKYLRARLRGPSMINYYPLKLTIADFNRMAHGELKLRDPDEEQRLQDVEDRKKRGKGAPRKAKSKGQFAALFSVYSSYADSVHAYSGQSENKQETMISDYLPSDLFIYFCCWVHALYHYLRAPFFVQNLSIPKRG